MFPTRGRLRSSNDRAGKRWRSSGCPATVDGLKQDPQARCVGRWQLVVHCQLVHGGSKDNHGSVRIVQPFSQRYLTSSSPLPVSSVLPSFHDRETAKECPSKKMLMMLLPMLWGLYFVQDCRVPSLVEDTIVDGQLFYIHHLIRFPALL